MSADEIREMVERVVSEVHGSFANGDAKKYATRIAVRTVFALTEEDLRKLLDTAYVRVMLTVSK